MYTARIENRDGELMILTGDEPVYQVIGITGLNPPRAQINLTTVVGLDGARFNSAKLETRNIVITVRINGEVEANRLRLYQYFRTREWCTFYYSNGTRDVSIEGYVESVECNLFAQGETAQISILCPFPFFRSIAEVIADSSDSYPQFTFPFSINIGEPVVISTLDIYGVGYIDVYNGSEVETGVIMSAEFSEAADKLEVKNVTTGEDMTLVYPFLPDDKIVIDTIKGEKSVTLIRGGVLYNLFAAIQPGSAFYQLAIGVNRFEYLVDDATDEDGDVFLTFRFYNLYRGV